MGKPYIVTIDQGTTGSRVFLISERGEVIASAYEEFTQHFPRPGWVEHDADEIWASVEKLLARALETSGLNPADAAAIGITNQRETTVVWEKSTGKPIHPAIVWQCRRTADYCEQLKKEGRADLFRKKTGLVLDAYFSGTKIKYILDAVGGARSRAENGELLFGTIDTFLLNRLTGEHKTDFTNASRTLIFNILEGRTYRWIPLVQRIHELRAQGIHFPILTKNYHIDQLHPLLRAAIDAAAEQ